MISLNLHYVKNFLTRKLKTILSLKFPSAFLLCFVIQKLFERTVKLGTDASQKVIGSKNRDGYINDLLSSPSKLPNFNTKKDCFVTAAMTVSIVQFAIITLPIIFCAFLIQGVLHYDSKNCFFVVLLYFVKLWYFCNAHFD